MKNNLIIIIISNIFFSGLAQAQTFKFFTMLDFFINTGVDLFWYGLGFYGGYKLGLINGGIKQLELIDKEFNENFKENA